ncbi:hypothetical protein YPPY66_1580, partial [Yersinia pestis PY-66]
MTVCYAAVNPKSELTHFCSNK